MAGLYQEGQRFPMYEEGKRFQTGPRPPMTMADYLRMLETRKRTSTMPEEIPSGLESANASPGDTIWRGKGLYGEQAFTNIPERAQAMGLRETMPPVPEGGYMETMPTGKTFSVEVPQAQAGGQGRSYAEKVKARQKLEAHTLEEDIPIAEAMELQKFWGVDNDSLDKAQKAEAVSMKGGTRPRFGVSVEAAARAMGYESFADVPTGEEANRVMEEARRQQALGVSSKEEAKAGYRAPSATERTALSDLETSISMLESLGQMYKPSYTGPVKGRAGAVQTFTGVGLEEGEANFRAATSTFRNQVIKAITGAQMSEPEAQRIRKQIPEENDPPEVWRAKQYEALRLLNNALVTKKDVLARGGYILGEERTAEPTGAATTGGGRVKVISPDGKVGTIPEGQLEQAIGKGYKRSQ